MENNVLIKIKANGGIFNTLYPITKVENVRGLNIISPALTPGDNTTAIQTALDTLRNNGGGILSLSNGTYSISKTLKVYSNTTIEGNGATIKGIADEKDIQHSIYALMLYGANNVTIRNLNFDNINRCIDARELVEEKKVGEGTTTITTQSSNITLENISASNMYKNPNADEGSYMIVLNKGVSNVTVENIRYNNLNVNGDCIRFKGDNSHIHCNNMVGKCGDVFIALCTDEDLETAWDDGSDGHFIRNCTFTNIHTQTGNYAGVGLEIRRAKSIIENVKFENCTFYADMTIDRVGSDDKPYVASQCPVCLSSTTHGYHYSVKDDPTKTRGGTLRDVTFEGCEFIVGSNTGDTRPAIRSSDLTLRNCVFENCKYTNTKETIETLSGIEFNYAKLYSVRIEGFVCENYKGNTNFNGIILDKNSITRGLVVDSCFFDGGVADEEHATNKKAYLLSIAGVDSSNTEISIENAKVQNCNSLVNSIGAKGILFIDGFSNNVPTLTKDTATNLKVFDERADVDALITTVNSLTKTSLKIINVGDSIALGSGTTPYVAQLTTDYKNVAVGGAMLSNVSTTKQPIYTQLDNATLVGYEPDVVIMDGGINDFFGDSANTEKPIADLGTIPTQPIEPNDTELNTIAGGLCKLFYEVQNKYPTSRKLFILVHKVNGWTWYGPTTKRNGYNQEELIEHLRAICKLYSIEVVDVYNESGIDPIYPSHKSTFFLLNDSAQGGVHPNTEGYKVAYVPLLKKALNL